MKWLCSLLLIMYLLVATEGQKSEMEEVEELLELGSTINLSNARRRLIVLLGSTGTGKSTLAKFMTNDPSLQIVSMGKSSYAFRDNGTIGTNIRKSMTVVPNVYQDPQTREIIVDLPGFSDTREPQYEIANAFFLKKVLEYPLQLKIVVTENHYSLIEGMDRFGLSRLLQNLAELIPNIERHEGSISLVVTKVENGIEEEDLKSELMNFLAGYRDELSSDLHGKSNNTEEKMLRVLNVLIGGGSGQNVAFFRKPTLRSPSAMQISRESIRTVIFTRTTWAHNINSVYRYSLSKISRSFISNTLSLANSNAAVAKLKDFFAVVKSSDLAKIQTLGSARVKTNSLNQLQNHLSSAKRNQLQTFSDISDLVRILSIFSTITFDVSSVTKLASRQGFFKEFDVDVLQSVVQEVRVQLEYMQQWVSNVQRQLQLEEQVELRAIAAKEEQIRVQNAAIAEQARFERVMAEARRAQEEKLRLAAEREAALARDRLFAEERARLAREMQFKAWADAKRVENERAARGFDLGWVLRGGPTRSAQHRRGATRADVVARPRGHAVGVAAGRRYVHVPLVHGRQAQEEGRKRTSLHYGFPASYDLHSMSDHVTG